MHALLALVLGGLGACAGLSLRPAKSLSGVSLVRARDGRAVDLGAALAPRSGKTLVVFGSHAADFNTIEYAQRASHFWPQMRKRGINRCVMVVNGNEEACNKLADVLDLPKDFELLADEAGDAGRRFGVSRGFLPDVQWLPPQVKLFVVGIGLGPPWRTLAAVLPGFFGSPGDRRGWVEAALKQGQLAGRSAGPLPSILNLGADGAILGNRFDAFPIVGSWGLRPLELATLRLQNLAGVQAAHWDVLKPTDDRCLTQLGGCAVVGPKGDPIFQWVDGGLCDVADFEDLIAAL